MELPPIDPVSSAKPLSPSHRVNPTGSGEGRQPREISHRATPNEQSSRTTDVRGGSLIAGGVELLEQALPVEILKDSALVRSEWAWRRLLIEQMGNMANTAIPTRDGQNTQVTAHTEQAIGYLRTLLSSLADAADSDDWQVSMSAAQSSSILQFNAIKTKQELDALPEKAKKWVLQDRLVSSTRVASTPKVGAGLFFPAAEQLAETAPRAAVPLRDGIALRWQAESQTKVSGQGKHVHRLTLQVRVGPHPVEITVVSSKPALYVHIASNEEHLVRKLDLASHQLRDTLSQQGWQVDGLSTGSLATGDDLP